MWKDVLLVDAFLPKQPALHRRVYSIAATYIACLCFVALLILSIIQAFTPPLVSTTQVKWSAGHVYVLQLTCLSAQGCWISEMYTSSTPGGRSCGQWSSCWAMVEGETRVVTLCASDFPGDGLLLLHNVSSQSTLNGGSLTGDYGFSVGSDMLSGTGTVTPMPSALHIGTTLLNYVETHNHATPAQSHPQELRREYFATLMSETIVSTTQACLNVTNVTGTSRLVMAPYYIEVDVSQEYDVIQVFGKIGGLHTLCFSVFGTLIAVVSLLHLSVCPDKCWRPLSDKREHPGTIQLDWRTRSMMEGLSRTNSARSPNDQLTCAD